MPHYLMDVFVHAGKIHVWSQDEIGKNHFFTDDFTPIIFFHTFNEAFARKILKKCRVEKTQRKDFVKKTIPVLKITFPSIPFFVEHMPFIEEKLRNVGTFYHVDIPLPEMYLFEHGLMPLGKVDICADGKNVIQSIRCVENEGAGEIAYDIPPWKILELGMTCNALGQITSWEGNGHVFHTGNIPEFLAFFESEDPDVILVHHSPIFFKKLLELCRVAEPSFSFSRVGTDQFSMREKTYFSYGKIYAKPTPLALKGRLLLAEYPHEGEGSEFSLLSYVEGARACRKTLQALVSHSIGSASNNRLMYEAYRSGYLIPYKIGLYEHVKPFEQLVENDRGPFTYEPTLGFHSNVIELDFVSMYPSIMHHYNLSPEKFQCDCCKPKTNGPIIFDNPNHLPRSPYSSRGENSLFQNNENPFKNTGYWFCQKEKGIVARVCSDFIRRRNAYKKKTDEASRAKVAYLKWLLVVIFGYQACTHKKIGTIEIHETINAIARETMVDTIHLAEEEGFTVLHAIVDSLYLKKTDKTPVSREEIAHVIQRINEKTHLKLEYKQSFSRMVFLPSIVNPRLPVPGRFYGIGTNGTLKMRGIEARQRSQPHVIKHMQLDVLNEMARFPRHTPLEWFRENISTLKRHIENIPHALPEHLAFHVRISKTDYATNIPQKQLLNQLKKEGKNPIGGHTLSYIIESASRKKYVTISQYAGKYDHEKYVELLKKAYLNLFLPLHVTLNEVNDLLDGKKQMRIEEYAVVKLLAIEKR